VVGHHDVEFPLVEQGLHVLAPSRHRGHGAGTAAAAAIKFAAPPRQPQEILGSQRAGRAQSGQLAEAVPSHGRRVHAGLAQDRQQGQAGRTQCGLGPLGRGQARALLTARGLVEHSPRKHDVVQTDARREVDLGCAIPHAQRGRTGHGHIRAHVQRLAALAREEKTDAALRRPGAKIDFTWHGETVARGQQFCGLGKFPDESRAGFGEHSQACRRRGVE